MQRCPGPLGRGDPPSRKLGLVSVPLQPQGLARMLGAPHPGDSAHQGLRGGGSPGTWEAGPPAPWTPTQTPSQPRHFPRARGQPGSPGLREGRVWGAGRRHIPLLMMPPQSYNLDSRRSCPFPPSPVPGGSPDPFREDHGP
eukprot:NP_001310354.1 uncharacterized protein LOC101927503 [Homo sapiens]